MLGKSKVKYIQSLGHKKQRDDAGVFIAEGPKLINELLSSVPASVKELYALPEWIHANVFQTVPVTEITLEELEKISQLQSPNKVLAVVEKFDQVSTVSENEKLFLMLDTIQDPGNFGTILRTADWFGITQVVCSQESADLYNSKVVQATMGSIIRVNVIYTDLGIWLDQHEYLNSYAAVLNGTDVEDMEKITEGVIIIGNEGKGIGEEVLKRVSNRITIPAKGKSESLNAAVATGIMLSHLIGSH